MINFNDQKSNYLTDLFHYDYSQKKYIQLKNGLEEYHFLLLNAYKATENLLSGNFEKFDSLVGENACQIRAIKIALIASSDLTYLNCLVQRLTKALSKIEELMLPSSINILMHKGWSLKDIINKYEINIYLNNPSEIKEISIVDLNGKVVYTESGFSNTIVKINLNDKISEGIYIVSVMNQTSSSKYKIVIAK